MSWKDGSNSKDSNIVVHDSKPLKKATYRIIHFPKPNKYIGLAWNYDEAVLISTRDRDNRSDARAELEVSCFDLGVKLQWFDGDYVFDSNSEQLVNYVPGGSGKSSVIGTEENLTPIK